MGDRAAKMAVKGADVHGLDQGKPQLLCICLSFHSRPWCFSCPARVIINISASGQNGQDHLPPSRMKYINTQLNSEGWGMVIKHLFNMFSSRFSMQSFNLAVHGHVWMHICVCLEGFHRKSICLFSSYTSISILADALM